MPFVEHLLRRATTLRSTATAHLHIVRCGSRRNLQSCRRAFHASPRRLIVEECLSTTHTVITGLHSITGLSWAYTLPLTALLIRLTIIAPMATYGKIIWNRRLELNPLLHAWRAAFARATHKAHRAKGHAACEKIIQSELRKKGRKIRGKMGLQYWKSSLTYVQLPVFIVAIDTIRAMCGVEQGLLGLFSKLSSEDDTGATQGAAEKAVNSFFEPSLATEGALWFPDLLVADPALVLPFALSASLLTTVIAQERRLQREGIPLGKKQILVGRILKILALIIGPAMLHLPSGMLIYWISSTWLAFGQNWVLDRYLPSKPLIKPCERKKHARSPVKSG